MNRRDFFKNSASLVGAIALPTIIPASALGRGVRVAPSDKIVMGCIGVGGMGTGHVRSFLGFDDVHIAAVCDVRRQHAERAKNMVDKKYSQQSCQIYNDYRQLLARPDIDAIVNATPDHWHSLIGLEAARQKIHMYYEKPLTRSIAESQAVRRAVKDYDVIFQFGTQQRSDQRFRYTCELVRNGKIGDLETIMIGSAQFEPIGLQPAQPVPDGLDYNMWLGPAPWAPYTQKRCTRNWTLISDYSLGCLSGAWGIHSVDIAQWANRSDDAAPITTEGWGKAPKKGLYDTYIEWKAEHTYANGVKLIHMDMETALKHAKQFELFWMAILFLGSEGWVYVGRGFLDAHPKSLLNVKFGPNDERLPVSQDHRRQFLDSVKKHQQPISHIDSAYYSDITCHHAHIAMTCGRKLTWNNQTEQFENDVQANRMLRRAMSSPWHTI